MELAWEMSSRVTAKHKTKTHLPNHRCQEKLPKKPTSGQYQLGLHVIGHVVHRWSRPKVKEAVSMEFNFMDS